MHIPFFKKSLVPSIAAMLMLSPIQASSQTTEAPKKEEPSKEKVVVRTITEKERVAAEKALSHQKNYQFDGLEDIATSLDTVIENNRKDAQQVKESAQQNVMPLSDLERNIVLQSPEFARFKEDYEDTIGLSASPDRLAKMNKKQDERKYEDDTDAFIAISMSMPKTSLEMLFYELSYDYKDKNVVLVLQGAEKGEFAKMSYTLNMMIPEDSAGNFDIVIDPTLYQKLDIDQVPMFVMNTDKGWRKVLGDVPFSQAVRLAQVDYPTFSASGPVYDIQEPNLMEVINQKMAGFDGAPMIEKAKEKVLSGNEPRVILDLAFESKSYMVDPTTTISEDLVFEGVMFAPAGTTINPLTIMPLTNAYAFVDLSLPEHIEQLRLWRKIHPGMRVMSTTIVEAKKQGAIMNEFGFVSQINDLVMTRFGLSEIPAIAYQVDDKLRVDVVAVQPKAITAQALIGEE